MGSTQTDLVPGTLDMLIMRALDVEPMHGFGVVRWIERVTDERLQIEEGALYPALHKMHRKGLLDAEWGKTENNRRARYYRLTVTGKAELGQRISTWEAQRTAITQVLEAGGA